MLGDEYVGATPMLMLLALTIPATMIRAEVSSLIYAYGMYTTILVLGLIGKLSRIVVYIPHIVLNGWCWGCPELRSRSLRRISCSSLCLQEDRVQSRL